MLRILDLTISALGLILGMPIFLVILLIVFLDNGSPIFHQLRIGRYQRPFVLIKFRTMSLHTVDAPTHLVDATAITPIGKLLRRTKLDELPQFWNVLRGDMSIVGPRPCLLTQTELISMRAAQGVFEARPGITGLAQLKGIDMSTPSLLAETDREMLEHLNVHRYFYYIVLTILGKGRGDRVRVV